MRIPFEPYTIRSYTQGDADAVARHANNPRIAAGLRDAFPSPYTLKDAEEWIALVRGEKPERNFVIATSEEVIGGIGLILQEDVYARSAELGYWLGEAYWGKGIMSEAVAVFTDFAFAQYDLVRIFACVFESNPASGRVLEKAGFTLEGRLRKSVFKNGRVLDSFLYAKILE